MKTALGLVLLLVSNASLAWAQVDAGSAPPPDPATLVQASAAPIELRAGARADAQVQLTILPSWHINANPPSPDYMIPTLVQIRPAFGVTPGRTVYAPPQQLKVAFDDKPLSVYTGATTVTVPLNAAATAVNGRHTLKGTVRYQSCNDQVCTAPTTIPFTVEVTISGGGAGAGAATSSGATGVDTAAAATAETTATSGVVGDGGGTGAQPLKPAPGTSLTANPIADGLAKGGIGAFALLFLLGLALNLTPCVYPMFGVTVSIFGARSAAPPIKVLGSALVYVLGIMTMYSVLGFMAGLTGGLFGSLLQNPFVQAGVGGLLVLMSLSMFGLYELQPPPSLLQRLGGSSATNAFGLFFSGLVVGVIAAPCVGPSVIALLTIVGAKADPWLGFRTFFTLSLGLGAPYLVLATSSNLLHGIL